MFHDQHVVTNGMYLPICSFFLSCPQPPMGISHVSSFPVQPGGSLIQFLRCRNLALNRVFPTFLTDRHVLYLGVSGCPLCSYAPYVCMPPYIHMPPRVYTPPICPHTPLDICMFSEASACCRGCKGPLAYWTPPLHLPLYGGVLPLGLHPHLFIGFPVHQYVLGISVCDMGNISPFVGGFGDVPHLLGVLGTSAHGVSICLFLYILVGIMSHVSTMATTTSPPVMVASSGLSSVSSVTVAPSPLRLPATMDQCGVVQPPPLMPRGSGGVICPTSVPQQQPPSLMPLLAYANYAMGSPQVGFFFRVEPPTVLYIICWCPFWCLLFYF